MVADFFKKNSRYFSLFGVLFFLTGLLWNGSLHGGDFKVFYLAGTRFLEHISIYQYADNWSPFKYHPAWAVLFSLWALLPFKLAVSLFNIVNLSFWAMAARHWARVLDYKLTPFRIFLLALFSLNALSAETDYGQLNGFLFWGATQIFCWLEDSSPKPVRAGILLAALISVKLNLGILLCYVLYKNIRAVTGLVAGVACLHVMTLMSFPEFQIFELYKSWLHLLVTQSSDQFNTFEVQSLLRLCFIVFGASLAKTVWLILLAGAVLFGIYLDKRGVEQKPLEKLAINGSYWLAVVFFFSPLAWWYHILYLFPLSFVVIKNSKAPGLRALALLCLGVFAFVGFNTVGREGIFNFKLYMGYFAAGILVCTGFIYAQLKARSTLRVDSEELALEPALSKTSA